MPGGPGPPLGRAQPPLGEAGPVEQPAHGLLRLACDTPSTQQFVGGLRQKQPRGERERSAAPVLRAGDHTQVVAQKAHLAPLQIELVLKPAGREALRLGGASALLVPRGGTRRLRVQPGHFRADADVRAVHGWRGRFRRGGGRRDRLRGGGRHEGRARRARHQGSRDHGNRDGGQRHRIHRCARGGGRGRREKGTQHHRDEQQPVTGSQAHVRIVTRRACDFRYRRGVVRPPGPGSGPLGGTRADRRSSTPTGARRHRPREAGGLRPPWQPDRTPDYSGASQNTVVPRPSSPIPGPL